MQVTEELTEAELAAASEQLQDFMRSGGQPLQAYNAVQFEPRLAEALGKFMSACHSSIGGLTLVASTRCVFFVACS